jgi:hypothetical protein
MFQAEDRYCRNCGYDSAAPLGASVPTGKPAEASSRKRSAAALLCFFLGVFGAHRFYAGRIGTGLLWLFTFGLLTFGMLFDLILILAGEFRDAEGRKILVW